MYKPLAGTKVVRFLLNGEDGTWIDPSTIRIQFELRNNEAFAKKVRPLGGPHLFFRRARVMVNGSLAEDILDYNRFHEQMVSLMPDHVRDNIDVEGFGHRWDDKMNKYSDAPWSVQTMPGIDGGQKQTVSFKPFFGLIHQSKLLPIKDAPTVIELEVVINNLDSIITPGVKSYSTQPTAEIDFTTTNTGIDCSIENICIKCDCCTLDNNLNNEYTAHLLSGKALPIKYTTFINQQSTISSKNVAVQVSRAVSRLQKCFITFYKTPTTETIIDKSAIKFYHPMETGYYNPIQELEFQIQLGGKLYPEYPCKSISECFTILKQTLNLPDWGLHSVGIDYKQYISNKFIFAMSFEKVPESSWTGTNTKSGQILIVKVSAEDGGFAFSDIANQMYITLVSEQILEIRDTACSIYD